MLLFRSQAQLTHVGATVEQLKSENEKLKSEIEKLTAKLEHTSISLHEADTYASHLRDENSALKIELRQANNKLSNKEKDEHKAIIESAPKRRRVTAYGGDEARQTPATPYQVVSRQVSKSPAASAGADVAAPPQLSARDLTPLVAQSHHQRQRQLDEASRSPIHIGSSPPPSTPGEDRGMSTPAPTSAPFEGSARRRPGRPRKVPGDDDKVDLILFVGKAGHTYLPLSYLEQSQQILITNTLQQYRDTRGWWVYMRTSQRKISMEMDKCLNKWTMNNRSTRTDMVLYADSACEYCRATGSTCARMVLHDGQYKLAVFPHHSHDTTIDEASFWLA
ncbi:uncharacterized protein J4E88_008133 [Alternaria novae-zelandiae]|uniref:uncharacterized protein n=1 Tax=Alternaria novae-zelandiae TaxID=430562 RepID=UPI0020C47EBB|nr:uncharacterized protein J4E88_008133 [Alternaria novae-zelandiae]KAI4674399.1 hypothetical protein J4E88_008133 [Alternaria novae-zelandiae]